MESQAYKVGIESTCSGAWPVIYEVCYDPDTHEEWNRELARCNSAFAETEAHRNSGEAATWNEDPSAFEPTADSRDSIGTAYLFAAAPMMRDVLREVLRTSQDAKLRKLAMAALDESQPPAELPLENPCTL